MHAADPLTLQLSPRVERRSDSGDVLLAGLHGALRLNRPGPALHSLLERLANGGGGREALCDAVMTEGKADSGTDLARLYHALDILERKGFVHYRLDAGGAPLATFEPLAPGFHLAPFAAHARARLSRFAYLRRAEDGLILECPLGRGRLVLHDERGPALVALLARAHSAAELSAVLCAIDEGTAQAFLGLLTSAGTGAATNADGSLAEDGNLALRQWEFHDLLFHARSRLGRHDYPYGGIFPFSGEISPLPAIRAPSSGARITLYKPDIARLQESDPSFARVAESRRSIRAPAERPLTAAQLGEFLYRVARVQKIAAADPADPRSYEGSLRPCAAGGAMHEIEFYLTLLRCEGIEPGLYRYDPLAHELEAVAPLAEPQKRLVLDACRSSGASEPPDALVILAARFQRMAWKYRSMAYAATLKNAGALYQQMYLAATAMGLAPCGLGGGDSDLFAEAAGLDYYEETSIGEFMLSSRPPA